MTKKTVPARSKRLKKPTKTAAKPASKTTRDEGGVAPGELGPDGYAAHVAKLGETRPLFLDLARLCARFDQAAPGGESVMHAIATTLVIIPAIEEVASTGYEFRKIMAGLLDEMASAYFSARLDRATTTAVQS